MTETAANIFRDYNTAGVPSSGEYKPEKALLRRWGAWVEAGLNAGTLNGPWKASLAALNADLAHDADTVGFVYTTSDIGTYVKSGASGAGSWTKILDYVPGMQIAAADDDGNSTANAWTMDTAPQASASDGVTLITGFFPVTNTSATVTVAFDGGTALAVKTQAGNDPSIGGCVAGAPFIGKIAGAGTQFRLLSDQASSAIQAAAEAARDAAQAAAASAVSGDHFDTVAGLLADTTYLGYAGSGATLEVAAGDIVRAQGFRYEVAASGASDEHLTTAGGLKLYVAEQTLNPLMFGAEVDAASDQQSALQAMFDAGGESIYVPPGLWRADTTLTCDHDVYMYGPGTFDFSNGTGQLLITGAGLTQLDALDTNVSKGDRVLSWADDQGLAARDIVVLYNDTDYSWGSRRAEYRDGAAFRIHSMSTFDANIYGQAVDDYALADFDIYKMSTVRAEVHGVGFIASSSTAVAPLTLKWCADSIVSGVRGHGGIYAIVELNQCFASSVEAQSPINASPVVNDEYGIEISNSTHINIKGTSAFATRHAVSIGGYDAVGAIPNRYINVSGMNLLNGADGDDVGAGDCHGNSDFVTFENCTLLSSVNPSGRNITLRGCTIFGADDTSGECVYTAEVVGGVHTIENCTLHSNGTGASKGFIHYIPLGPGDGMSLPAETTMREDFTLIVRDVTLVTPNASSLGKVVAILSQNADKKINVMIDGVKWIAPDGLGFLYAADDDLSAIDSDGFSVDNVQGPDGAYIIYATSDISAVPTREMRQAGRATITTTASTLNTATAVDFRYPYSRSPTGSCAISLTDGSASGQTAGQNAIPKLYAISSTQIRPAMLASANFTAGVSVDLHWSAEVREF